MLQPHDFDVKEKSKHKFMVQSMITVKDAENLDSIVRAFHFDILVNNMNIMLMNNLHSLH